MLESIAEVHTEDFIMQHACVVNGVGLFSRVNDPLQ